MKRQRFKRGYWTESKVKMHAKECNHKTEFEKKYPGGYNSAKKLGILNELGFISIGNRFKRCIYCFEFSDNSVYIGLTHDFEERVRDHISGVRGKTSVFKHISKNPSISYKTLQLTEYLDQGSSIKAEIFYIEEYKEKRFKVLNKATGGALGGAHRKWNKQQVIDISKKFKSAKEMKKENYGAYMFAVRHKFTKELSYR